MYDMSMPYERPRESSSSDPSSVLRPEYANAGPIAHLPEGFPFDVNSPLRRYTEPAAALLFPYIAGLTIMNDEVAAAVKMHSGFRERPWARLLGTANAALTLVMGNQEESIAKAHELWKFHQTVRGSTESVPYSANDATLQTWVLACVFKGIEESSRRWATPLQPDQRSGVYEDIKTFGQVFGIQPELLPPDVAALDHYWEDKLNGDDLLQTEVSRRMAKIVFRFESPQVPKPLGRLGQAMLIGSLDQRLQDKADIHPTPLDHRLSNTVDGIMQYTYARLPRNVRVQAVPAVLGLRRYLASIIRKKASSAAPA